MSQGLTLEQLRELEGQTLTPTAWCELDQERISAFAACTEDEQFIHVDAARMRESPWGTTIAHGFLTLSLTAGMLPVDTPRLAGAVMTLNYGLDRVRFLSPVPCGSQVRFLTRVLAVREKAPGRILIKLEKTLELKDSPEPAMVAELLVMQILETPKDD